MKALFLAVLGLALGGEDDLAARASAIKPTERELTWLKIPWVLDLMEAQRAAKAENRPVFLWATGDDPLERC